jgi:hypothetical protein
MQLLSITKNVDLTCDNLAKSYSNNTRYYVDGKRVSRSKYNGIKESANRLDCSQTIIKGNKIYHYVCAR